MIWVEAHAVDKNFNGWSVVRPPSVGGRTCVGVLAPDIALRAGRHGVCSGRAFVPGHGACLPAIHDTSTIDGSVAAYAAFIRRIGWARA